MVQRITTSDNKLQRMTTSDNEWQRWQRMTASGATNESEWEQVKQSDLKFQNEKKDWSGS